MERIIINYRSRDLRSEPVLAACNYFKHNWYAGWYIGSTFHKATTQEESDALQYDYELYRYFRNRANESEYDNDNESDTETETETEAENDT